MARRRGAFGKCGSVARSTLSTTWKNQNHTAFCCGAFGAGPSVEGGSRNNSSMRMFFGLRARGFSAISTSSGTMTVRLQYEILSRWNGNHFGSSMISTGITGTARHGMKPNSASSSLVKTLDRAAPPRAAHRLARPRHVRRVDVVADRLQREIGFHAGAHVERAVMEQRPAAVLALDAAQIDGDLALQLGIHRLGQIMTQQHIFGRNGGIGFELEAPVPVRLLGIEHRPRRRRRCCC